MARRVTSRKKKSRVAAPKKPVLRRATARLRPAAQVIEPAPVAAAPKPRKRREVGTARPPRREADVPMEILARTYTPRQTSLKASFRASGVERQRDQDFVTEERWSDEDHFTNKSGDPRIGTHHRKYEPGE
jgi:hypothetical protein